MESQWLATPSPNKSLKAMQFSLRLLHLRVFRFHCAEEPEMWDFNWDIFLGLLACGAFQFGVTGPPTLWYSGSAFEPKASSHLFAATSFVSKYQVATEVPTAVSEPSLALRLNQEMTLLPCTREFLAHSRNVVSKWQCRDPLGEACPIHSVTVACPITR
jgi:hypothetical protein